LCCFPLPGFSKKYMSLLQIFVCDNEATIGFYFHGKES
jgi:hypothetical protein